MLDFDFHSFVSAFMKARLEEGLERYEGVKVDVTIKSLSSCDGVIEIVFNTGEVAKITIEKVK